MGSSLILRSALISVVVALVGCTKSACPFESSSTVTVESATPCLEARVEACLDAVLIVRNNCSEVLTLPIDYAVFPGDAYADPSVEVVPGAGVNYEVRRDRASSTDASGESYSIPATLGAANLTFRFRIEHS